MKHKAPIKYVTQINSIWRRQGASSVVRRTWERLPWGNSHKGAFQPLTFWKQRRISLNHYSRRSASCPLLPAFHRYFMILSTKLSIFMKILKQKSLEGMLRNQNWLCNLWGPVQNENVKPLGKKSLKMSRHRQQSIEANARPFWARSLCDCTGHTAMRPALQGINHVGMQAVKFMS